MSPVLLGIAYFAYAFIQASVQVRLGHTFSESEHLANPAADLFGFMVFAPVITVFYLLVAVLAVPAALFVRYAQKLRNTYLDRSQ